MEALQFLKPQCIAKKFLCLHEVVFEAIQKGKFGKTTMKTQWKFIYYLSKSKSIYYDAFLLITLVTAN